MSRRIEVIVHAGAAKPRVEERADGLHVWVAAPPVEGAANEAVLKAVAAHLGVPPTAVTLLRGRRSRRKLVEIPGRPSTSASGQAGRPGTPS